MKKNNTICVIGLGYVGLPLAVSFANKFKVIGFDKNSERIDELLKFHDRTGEISRSELKKKGNIKYTSDTKDLSIANIYIVTVPTPVKNKNPDLSHLKNATKIISKYIKKNDYVIYESTVYPGVTETLIKDIIEKKTKLKLNKDFYAGYSPERINPSDKDKKLENIKKVVSGSNNLALNFVNKLYLSIIKAGTFKASSIAVAEAAKVIENAQRDINIAFINELAVIFNKLNLNFKDILEASSTKWNFLNFKPGLVGGHCIGVDPYYLTYISKKNGYSPKVILSGRKINDQMGIFIANDFKKKITNNKNKNILILGYTFKEDCSDVRNTKVFDLFISLRKTFSKIDIYDHKLIKSELSHDISKYFIKNIKKYYYDAIILAVPHKKFLKLGTKGIGKFLKKDGCIYDLKHVFKKDKNIYHL